MVKVLCYKSEGRWLLSTNFSFASLRKLQRYTANGNKAHNAINNAMREFS